MEEVVEKSQRSYPWKMAPASNAQAVSFKELIEESRQQKKECNLSEKRITEMGTNDDYLLALRLQEEFDSGIHGIEDPVHKYHNDVNEQEEDDDDYALALQLQMEEERQYQVAQQKGQVSTKFLTDNYSHSAVWHSRDIAPIPKVEGDTSEKYLGINSPFLGDDVDNPDILIRPASNILKHEKEHIGKASRLARSMDHAGNLDAYSIDDKGLVKMRKYYGHKKDRTLRAPKENKLTTNSTIDNNTRLLILNFINNGYFDELGSQIQTGKEGTVFSAVRSNGVNEEWFCVKVYKVLTMEFQNKKEYMNSDHRFASLEGISSSDSKIVHEWTRKEHFNLRKLFDQGIPCPEPILYEKNILVMKMIGEGDQPAPALKDVVPGHQKVYRRTIVQCIHLLRKMYQDCSLVHGDFSEYNLLMMNDQVYVIDVGQSVNLLHHLWDKLLKRDVHNILNFYHKCATIRDIDEVEERLYDYILTEFTETLEKEFDTYLMSKLQ